MNLDPEEALDDYVRHVVKFSMFSRRILGSPIYRRFFAAAPGLAELMVLGKIMILEEDGLLPRPIRPHRARRARHRPRPVPAEGAAGRLAWRPVGPVGTTRAASWPCCATASGRRSPWSPSPRRWRWWRRSSSRATSGGAGDRDRRACSSTPATSGGSRPRRRRRSWRSSPPALAAASGSRRAPARRLARRPPPHPAAQLTQFYDKRLRAAFDDVLRLPYLYEMPRDARSSRRWPTACRRGRL